MTQGLVQRVAIAGLLLGALAAAPAVAQQTQSEGEEADTEQFEDWVVRCPVQEAGRCEMSQLVDNPANGEPMMRVVMGYPERIDSAAMIFVLPLGTRLTPGVRLVVDAGETQNIPFQVCLQQGCRADFKLEDSLRQQMRVGQAATVSVIGPRGERIDLEVSLQGFTAADDRIQP